MTAHCLALVAVVGALLVLGSPRAAAAEAFETPMPASKGEWETGRAALRAKLWALLGDLPPADFVPEVKVVKREARRGYSLETFTFDNRAGATVYGYCMVPEAKAGEAARRPAILYNHYHGGKYALGKDEMVTPAYKESLGELVPAEELARAGYVVLGVDCYAFGPRNLEGPGPATERGGAVEQSTFKLFLWQGRTMWGMIVRDDLLALNVLASRPDVDAARIGAMGASMGATRSWWLAALDDRIKATVSVCCTTRYQELIEARLLGAHGIYYYVPGMLKARIDAEAIHGLIAPRAHLTLNGDKDPTSPVAGVRKVNAWCERLYGEVYKEPGQFRGVVYEDTPHSYTKGMWEETVGFFRAKL